MNIHFYTHFANVRKLYDGAKINIWTKDEAVHSDVHISLNIGEFTIDHIDGNVYEAYRVN